MVLLHLDLVLLAQLSRRLAPTLLARESTAPQISPAQQHRKIKVGFLSVFMKEHSIGKVFGPVVATLGSANLLQVMMYTMDQTGLDSTHHAKETKATDFFANYVKQFGGQHIHLSQKADQAKKRIEDDNLDVLVYLEGRRCNSHLRLLILVF